MEKNKAQRPASSDPQSIDVRELDRKLDALVDQRTLLSEQLRRLKAAVARARKLDEER